MRSRELEVVESSAVMPPPVVVSKDVRARIASDHALLRGLMGELVAAARAAARDEKQRPVVRELIAQLRDEAERHFAYEDRALAPLLRGARAEAMEKDHEAQRAMFVALAEDAEDGARVIEALVEEILWFVRRFEQDMETEEERLLTPEALGASA
jgi:hemerythrin